MQPVVLDLDGSVGPLAQRVVVPLREFEDALRFACTWRAMRAFARKLDAALPINHGTVFTGSGDFHHLSLPLIARAGARFGPLRVVVFDNHPDNMRFPFGVHCGSWVRRAALSPCVAHVDVVGITSSDIAGAHAWENYLKPLRTGRLTYWSCGVSTGWAKLAGLACAFRSFSSVDKMIDAFSLAAQHFERPVYLSIDKDVLGVDAARTNWDQGRMTEAALVTAVAALHGRVIGSDITGEVSVAHYGAWWKRMLSALDRQPPIPTGQLSQWQRQQHLLNTRLLAAIDAASAGAGGSRRMESPSLDAGLTRACR